jgi:hypothetical protein
MAFFGGADMTRSRSFWSPSFLGAVFGFFVLCLPQAEAALPRRFPERFQFFAGQTIQRIAFGDINGDGRLDAFAQTAVDSVYSTYLGDANGGFVYQGDQVLAAAEAIALADLDGDGRADAVLSSTGANTIVEYPSLANGGFGASRLLAAPTHPTTLAVADLNGDGRADLVVTTLNDSRLRTYLQANDGSFTLAFTAVTSSNASALTLADLDHDGHLDALVSHTTGKNIRTYRGLATGEFVPTGLYATNDDPSPAVVGDFDGDGVMDFAYFDGPYWPPPHVVWVRYGTGTGLFGPTHAVVSEGLSGGPPLYSIAAGDWNGDGIADLAVDWTRTLTFLGSSDRSFTPYDQMPAFPGVTGLVARDFDSDGKTDLASFGPGVNGLSLAFARQGMFGDGIRVTTPEHGGLFSTAIGDVDGDGKMEEAILGENDSVTTLHAMVYQFGSDGSPVLRNDVARPMGTVDQSGLVRLHDMNADGRDDLLTLNTSPTTVGVYLSQLDGGFSAPFDQTVPTYAPVGFAVGSVVTGSRGDAVVGDLNNSITNYPGGVKVLRGVGDGSLAPVQYNALSPTYPSQLVLGDVNGDGFTDVITCYDNVVIYLGNGTERFTIGGTLFPGGRKSLAFGDLNNDGHPDLLTCSDGAGIYSQGPGVASLSIMAGDGHGGFAAPYELSTHPASQVAIADIDGDGLNDIVASHPGRNSISIYYGRPDGFPGNEDEYFVADPAQLQVFDADGDGRPDITYVSPDRGTLEVMLQRSAAVAVGTPPPSLLPTIQLASANPARGSMSFRVQLSEGQGARLGIFDLHGRVVREYGLVGDKEGRASATWDARLASGVRASSGVYFARLTSERTKASTKFVLMN